MTPFPGTLQSRLKDFVIVDLSQYKLSPTVIRHSRFSKISIFCFNEEQRVTMHRMMIQDFKKVLSTQEVDKVVSFPTFVNSFQLQVHGERY